MSEIKLLAGLPKGQANGLRDHASKFIDDPDTMRVAVVLLDTKSITEDRDKGENSAAARVVRVEVIGRGDDVKALQRIMLRAFEERTGQEQLPFETEEAIEQVFADWSKPKHDPDTGEIIE